MIDLEALAPKERVDAAIAETRRSSAIVRRRATSFGSSCRRDS
jgi:hypothetical protein